MTDTPPASAPRSTAATLMSATLYLMSAYATHGCPRLAIMIRRHLDLLAAHPDADPLLASTSAQLIERYWAQADAQARKALAPLSHAPARTGVALH